ANWFEAPTTKVSKVYRGSNWVDWVWGERLIAPQRTPDSGIEGIPADAIVSWAEEEECDSSDPPRRESCAETSTVCEAASVGATQSAREAGWPRIWVKACSIWG